MKILLMIALCAQGFSAPTFFPLVDPLYSTAERETPMSITQAINIAGRQRMLSQFMLRCYLAEYLGIDAAKHQKDLERAVKLFEKRLEELSLNAPSPEIGKEIREMRKIWETHKALISAKPNAQELTQAVQSTEEVLAKAHQIVLAYEAHASSLPQKDLLASNEEFAVLINKAGRQRMLSQRITWLALAKYGKLDIGLEPTKLLNQAIGEYEEALQFLIESPHNSDKIKEKLSGVFSHWQTLTKNLLAKKDWSSEQFAQLTETSNQLLLIMDETTNLYAKLIQLDLSVDESKR